MLAHVRDRRPDAELAVRLGVTVGEVRQRLEALAQRLGVEGRPGLFPVAEELGGGRPAATSRVRPWLFTVSMALAFVCGIAVGALSTARPSAPTGSPFIPPTPATTAGPSSPTLPGGTMVGSFGRFIERPPGAGDFPIAAVEERPGLTVVDLAGTSVLHLDAGGFQPGYTGDLAFGETTIDSVPVRVYVLPGSDQTALARLGDTLVVVNVNRAQPRLLIWARAAGPAGTPYGGPIYPVSIDLYGTLLVHAAPVSDATAIDGLTGAAVTLAGESWTSQTTTGLGETICPVGRGCYVAWFGEFAAPSDGTLACNEDGVVEFRDTETGIGLRLRKVGASAGVAEACPSGVVSVMAQQWLTRGSLHIHAVGREGQELALVLRSDGRLSVAERATTFPCPCFPRDVD